MKKQIKQFKIIDIERGNNSYYGNPSYLLILLDENNKTYYGKTASNAFVAYVINNTWIYEKKFFQYHITRKGNMIIDKHIRHYEG